MSTTTTTTHASTFERGVAFPWWQSAVVAVLGTAVFVWCYSTLEANDVTEGGVITELPIFVDQYMGNEQEVSLAERTMLPADTIFAKKQYTSLRGEAINCQIVLSGGEKRSIHRPEVCLPGQGWIIKDARQVPIALDNGNTQNVMKLTLTRVVEVAEGDRRNITCDFYYWFIGKDKTTAEHKQRVWLTSWDRVFHNVNHRWAYVIVSGILPELNHPSGIKPEQVSKELQRFIGRIAPQIQKPNVVSS